MNYLLPGAVLPTTPRALYTTVAVTAAGITGVIVVLCAKIAFALARSETRRAALFGLVSVAGAWLGFLAALETVGGMRLATEDKRELVLVAAIAAVAFFAVPKRRYRRARTLARDMRDTAAALDEYGLRSWLIVSPALSLIAQYLGAVLLLWMATWHLGHVLPAPLSFASVGALLAAAGWVTLARVPVIVGAWFWGPPKESEA